MKIDKTQNKSIKMSAVIHNLSAKSKQIKNIGSFVDENINDIKMICRYAELTPLQALLFAIIFDMNFLGSGVSLREISNHLGLEPLEFADYIEDVYTLKSKRVIRNTEQFSRRKKTINDMCFEIPQQIIDSFLNNKPIKKAKISITSIDEFLQKIDEIIEERMDNKITFEDANEDITRIFQENKRMDFVIRMNTLQISLKEQIILVQMGHKALTENNDFDLHGLLKRISSSTREQFELKKSLVLGSSKIVQEKLICFEEGMFRGDKNVSLAEKGLQLIFGDNYKVFLKESTPKKPSGMTEHKSIVSMRLFYNQKPQKQIDQLTLLLKEENYARIEQSMKLNGLHNGFPILFYGSSGTGKTETVYQLAKACERDIKAINISETKSMWFGESEKLIKQVFSDYKECLEQSERAPILLFNEADGIFGKRTENVQRAVDQTSNAIQNIILQEMENLNGIMIATSNLVQNLDSAFERRFLYKIKFEKPGIEVRASIWKEKIPSLNIQEAEKLATRFDFSGGQIENISRKFLLSEILNGKIPILNELIEMCMEENVEKNTRNIIGYNII